MDAFTRDFCRCNHSIQNLIINKTFILDLIRLKLWEFVLLQVGKATIEAYVDITQKHINHYSGLCRLKG